MEAAIEHFVQSLPGPMLALLLVLSIAVLAKGADRLVEEAVALSTGWKIPKAVVGATIVSLGTTLPEAAVSVMAALRGSPGLALGNAAGSILCDTGLVLGIALLIGPIPLDRSVVNRQGWLQLGAGILFVVAAFPFSSPGTAFTNGGRIAQWVGWVLVALLVVYIWKSIQWARTDRNPPEQENPEGTAGPMVLIRLAVGVVMVVGGSWILIPCVQEAALRVGVPEAIIAATLVAFGTSLPELVTAITAARRGHGELALGNVIGADILNVLFVVGVSAAVTPGGLLAPPHFFRILFPAMLGVLVVLRIGIWASGDQMKRPFGFLLLALYAGVLVASYTRLAG